MPNSTPRQLNPLHLLIAFGTGGLLTLMVFFNGELGHYGNPLFASWAAHGTGTVAAILFLLYRRRPATEPQPKPAAPFWAYLGGISGALTVMLTSTTVNSPWRFPARWRWALPAKSSSASPPTAGVCSACPNAGSNCATSPPCC